MPKSDRILSKNNVEWSSARSPRPAAVHNLAFLGCGFSGMCRHLENVLVANFTVVEIDFLSSRNLSVETHMLFSHCVCALHRVFDK